MKQKRPKLDHQQLDLYESEHQKELLARGNKRSSQELSPKIRKILEKLQKDFQEEKPFLIYSRHTSFKGEPCDNCGSRQLVHGEGRYIGGGDEDDVENGSPCLFLCGACLNKLEKVFDMMME